MTEFKGLLTVNDIKDWAISFVKGNAVIDNTPVVRDPSLAELLSAKCTAVIESSMELSSAL